MERQDVQRGRTVDKDGDGVARHGSERKHSSARVELALIHTSVERTRNHKRA